MVMAIRQTCPLCGIDFMGSDALGDKCGNCNPHGVLNELNVTHGIKTEPQLLHLVFGGEVTSVDNLEFKDTSKLDIVGIYSNFAEAKNAWKGKAQSTVDNAQMRYVVCHIHKLFDEVG